MMDEIGGNAGVVWSYLDEHGEVSIRELVQETGLRKKQVNRAIGWLAREGKVSFVDGTNEEVVSLATDPVAE
jgi:transcription initiation factor IIE alpha subunit